MASAKDIVGIRFYTDPQVLDRNALYKAQKAGKKNEKFDKKRRAEKMKSIYERKLSSYEPGKAMKVGQNRRQEMKDEAFGEWYEDDERRDEVKWIREQKKKQEAQKMAGNTLEQRRKRVNQQTKQAQKQDKLYPREVYDGNQAVGKFPFSGHSEDVTPQSRNIRQGRQYWLQHDLDVMKFKNDKNKRNSDADKKQKLMNELYKQYQKLKKNR